MEPGQEKTGAYHPDQLKQGQCDDCLGTGELRIESENINEDFEVEKQLVITQCPRCAGKGYL